MSETTHAKTLTTAADRLVDWSAVVADPGGWSVDITKPLADLLRAEARFIHVSPIMLALARAILGEADRA